MKDLTTGTQRVQGATAFYRQRQTFLRNWPQARKDLGLGAEWKLVSQLVERCATVTPWAWVQTGTQAEWAAAWGIPERTFKRHLRSLLDRGVIIGEVTPVTAGVRSPKLKAAYEFPVYRLHPEVLAFAICYFDRDRMTCRADVLRKLAYQEPVKCQNQAPEEPYQETVKCQFGTYRLPATPISGGSSKWSEESSPTDEIPDAARGLAEEDDPFGDKYLTAQRSTIVIEVEVLEPKEEPDGVRRRLRRRRRTGERNMVNRWADDDEPPAIGADPDRPTSTGGKTPAATIVVLDAFERAWDAARRDDRLPPRPYSTAKSRVACLGWLKQTFLPGVGGDVELAVAIVELFCEQVAAGVPGWRYAPNPERGSWDLWKHLSPRVETTRQLLIDRGWKSEAEQAEEARRSEVRAAQTQELVHSRQAQATDFRP